MFSYVNASGKLFYSSGNNIGTSWVVEYSEQCTQGSLSSCNWAEAVNDHDLEEKFEMYSQENRAEFEGS